MESKKKLAEDATSVEARTATQKVREQQLESIGESSTPHELRKLRDATNEVVAPLPGWALVDAADEAAAATNPDDSERDDQ